MAIIAYYEPVSLKQENLPGPAQTLIDMANFAGLSSSCSESPASQETLQSGANLGDQTVPTAEARPLPSGGAPGSMGGLVPAWDEEGREKL